MRFKTSWIAVGMAMTASAAVAQESRLDIRVSKDGVNWSSSVVVNQAHGDSGRVYVGYFMTYVPSAGGVVPNAFASLTFQPVFSNVRFGTDTIAAFAIQGNNTNGGAIDPRADFSQPGGFGRIKPWAATGPSTSQSFVVHQHTGGSGNAPLGNFYRIARNDVSRWMGTGATSGTAAVNNFNGAGGMVNGQKQVPGAADPARIAGYENLLLMVLAIDTGPVPSGTTHIITAQAPTSGMSRDATTGVRQAAWYANTSESAPSIRAAVVSNDATISIEDECPVPNAQTAINAQPSSQATVPGAAVVLAVQATGLDLSYQWRRSGVPLTPDGRIGGITSPTLTIPFMISGDQGLYDCVVTGTCGWVISSTASLTCTPIFTRQPESGVFPGGSTITLATDVTTSGSTTYRWRRDGVNLFNSTTHSGVATPTLTIRDSGPNDSATYTLAVTNACGVRESQAAVVEVFCVGDFNDDGGVDAGDVEAFFGAWEQGEQSSDINADGGVDGQDLFLFFDRWQAGC
ncbi:MAG: GC-type dockerin domain-anchored protein [Phycisphaerales bacterium]